jgi:hypothetical protein
MSKERSEFLHQPVHHLFPVSKQSASASFESIFNALETGKNDFIIEKIKIFEAENKDLFDVFSVSATFLHETTENDSLVRHYLLGGLLGYTTLREEAFSRGGTLPIISKDVIRTSVQDSLDIEGNVDEFFISFREKVDLKQNIERIKNATDDNMRKFFDEERELTAVIKKYIHKIEGPHEARLFLLSFINLYSIFKTNSEIEKIRSIFKN